MLNNSNPEGNAFLGVKHYIFILFLILTYSSAEAQTLDSTEVYKAILYVGYFNDGSVPDTLIGTAKAEGRFMPRFIKWGVDSVPNGIPQYLKFPITQITYPNWKDLRVACNLETMNPDTMMDIVLFIWGKVPLVDTTYKDTATALVIFGQKGLDTTQNIIINQIQPFQIQPFVAMNMRMGTEFTDGKIRDISNVPSYVVNPIPINTDTTVLHRLPSTELLQNGQEEPDVKIYPNPAVYYTNLEINKITPGQYTVQVINMQGKLLEEQKIEVTQSKDFMKTLNLNDIATGVYNLRISTQEKLIGNYQIIVVH